MYYVTQAAFEILIKTSSPILSYKFHPLQLPCTVLLYEERESFEAGSDMVQVSLKFYYIAAQD